MGAWINRHPPTKMRKFGKVFSVKRLNRICEKGVGMCIHFSRFVRMCLRNRKKSIYIFDLDNTLADTFSTLIHRNPNELERLENIVPFERMCALANKINNSPSRCVFVLTARQYSTEKITQNWVANAGISIVPTSVFIVLSAMQKVWLLKIVAPFCHQITFIDDMSFMNSNGEIEFYEKEVAALPKKIRYIGNENIRKFNASTSLHNE